MPATTASPRRPDALGVHSLDRFAIGVPDADEAERFYRAFGLDVRRDGADLDLRTHGDPHTWGHVHANGRPKAIEYLSFGAYAEDFDALAARLRDRGSVAPHPRGRNGGIWTRDADGTPVEIVAAPRNSPAEPSPATPAAGATPGKGTAPSRSTAAPVHPRRMSHVLLFTPDVNAQVAFYRDVLGLRLSDRSGDIIAFMHAPHASDHHILAFAKSDHPGYHHSSWDVGSIDDVGLGAERMRGAGFANGWGVGRHIIGSNYFYYVQDPWGSWAEYTFGIDFVPADVEWSVADHTLEDAFYVWGPQPPDDFVVNREQRG